MLDDLGLIPAVQWHAREVSRSNNLAVQVQADTLPEIFPTNTKLALIELFRKRYITLSGMRSEERANSLGSERWKFIAHNPR